MTMRMTRRRATTLVGAALIAPSALAQTSELLTRAIPSVPFGRARLLGGFRRPRQNPERPLLALRGALSA
jgi:hypothetical protein